MSTYRLAVKSPDGDHQIRVIEIEAGSSAAALLKIGMEVAGSPFNLRVPDGYHLALQEQKDRPLADGNVRPWIERERITKRGGEWIEP
jgi:hypothetical protein